jgi:hypothetical protein
MVKLNRPQFIIWEIKRIFSSIPQILLFALAVFSGWLIYRHNLIEVHRAILEGIVAGYIFYWFVDILPKLERNAKNVKAIASELAQILQTIQTLKAHIKEEMLAIGQGRDSEKFFELLETLRRGHMPITNNMKRIKGTTAATTTSPMQFQYSNVEEVLYSELARLEKRLQTFERVSTIYGLVDLDAELMRMASDMVEPPRVSAYVGTLHHINNASATFGSDFDLIEGSLTKIKTGLATNWRIKFD